MHLRIPPYRDPPWCCFAYCCIPLEPRGRACASTYLHTANAGKAVSGNNPCLYDRADRPRSPPAACRAAARAKPEEGTEGGVRSRAQQGVCSTASMLLTAFSDSNVFQMAQFCLYRAIPHRPPCRSAPFHTAARRTPVPSFSIPLHTPAAMPRTLYRYSA